MAFDNYLNNFKGWNDFKYVSNSNKDFNFNYCGLFDMTLKILKLIHIRQIIFLVILYQKNLKII